MDYSKWIEETLKVIGDFFEKNKKEITAGAIGGVIGGGVIGTATYLIEDEQKKKAVIEAKKEGYEEAAKEYGKKMKEQAEEFISQKKNAQRACEEYKKLLLEYEKYIEELKRENAVYSVVKEHLERYEELKKLQSE